MRIFFFGCLFLTIINSQLTAQRACSASVYEQAQYGTFPGLKIETDKVENFIKAQLASHSGNIAARGNGELLVRIPVVVHILYNQPSENISVEKITSQLKALNDCYRRDNADSVNTPARFKSIAADCEIEFALAISDSRKRSTTGIIRKYTPVTSWGTDDKMKFSAEGGDDAWDAKSFLNIWVCNLGRTAGYSSVPGGPADKDGIVIGYNYFGTSTTSGYELGKTAVHEAGHWFGLKHTWGDDYCGDDLVGDTPKQSNFTTGCPSGIRLSCDRDPVGDMYMNYMDLTNDGCINLFTEGQKARMQALFVPGGARNSFLYSTGLNKPLISEIPLPGDDLPTWYHPQLYPNPSSGQMTLDLSYDIRWIGKNVSVTNAQGQVMMQLVIGSKVQQIDVSKLAPGFYFLSGKKEGASIKVKFIKM
jgi:Pregnancy-associated plasma protein-A/Secretion system C-terminal sorting domain